MSLHCCTPATTTSILSGLCCRRWSWGSTSRRGMRMCTPLYRHVSVFRPLPSLSPPSLPPALPFSFHKTKFKPGIVTSPQTIPHDSTNIPPTSVPCTHDAAVKEDMCCCAVAMWMGVEGRDGECVGDILCRRRG
jgi:hypothetical protein